jgi:uridine kinase
VSDVFFIGLGGGTGSGKTTIAEAFTKGIPEGSVTLIPLDSYYRDNTDLSYEDRGSINYDHPDAFEWDLLISHLGQLRQGNTVGMPVYNFARHRRLEEHAQVKPCPIIVVEGILALYNDALRQYFDMCVFVDAEADERILRRIERDTRERGRSLDSVIEQYRGTVKPMHNAFVEPTKAHADIIIPEGLNQVAVDLVRAKIQNIVQLQQS